jgi:hypothetical protein
VIKQKKKLDLLKGGMFVVKIGQHHGKKVGAV